MRAFLALPAERRRNAFLQMEQEMGLQAFSVEKDFWVCWTLRELFGLPGAGEYLTFKGGTSLSKAWGLIERFSEDIDLIVAKEALGFGGDAAPDKARSNKQRKLRLEKHLQLCGVSVFELRRGQNVAAIDLAARSVTPESSSKTAIPPASTVAG